MRVLELVGPHGRYLRAMMDVERRRALEAERAQLQLRMAEWALRLDRAGASSAGDYVVPPLAGCAVAVPLFAALAIYAVRNVDETAPQGTSQQVWIGCVAIFVVVLVVTFWIRRRMRISRIAEATRTYNMAIIPLRARLSAIESELQKTS